jgi:predicted enzyme related to lactoylglutathione lyase
MTPHIFVVTLYAEDLIASTHFYRDVIGLSLVPHHGERPHFDLGGIYLALVKVTPLRSEIQPAERFPIIAFAVDDLDTAIRRLQMHPVELPWGIEQDTGSRWVMFNDPAGNLIELVQLIHSQTG